MWTLEKKVVLFALQNQQQMLLFYYCQALHINFFCCTICNVWYQCRTSNCLQFTQINEGSKDMIANFSDNTKRSRKVVTKRLQKREQLNECEKIWLTEYNVTEELSILATKKKAIEITESTQCLCALIKRQYTGYASNQQTQKYYF